MSYEREINNVGRGALGESKVRVRERERRKEEDSINYANKKFTDYKESSKGSKISIAMS